MFVDYEAYKAFASANPLTEPEYERLAPFADLIIDHWTLGRAGRASAANEELPESLQALYSAAVEAVPSIREEMGAGDRVASFSNGVDSFTFENLAIEAKLRERLGWMLSLLPVEWVSACVGFEGGNAYAG